MLEKHWCQTEALEGTTLCAGGSPSLPAAWLTDLIRREERRTGPVSVYRLGIKHVCSMERVKNALPELPRQGTCQA